MKYKKIFLILLIFSKVFANNFYNLFLKKSKKLSKLSKQNNIKTYQLDFNATYFNLNSFEIIYI